MAEGSKDFRAAFDPERQSIERDLASLHTVPKAEIQDSIDSLVQRIHALEKTVTDKISILPPFDTRVCLEAIKAMSYQLSQLRTKLVPRPKFSFKSRKAIVPTSPSSLAIVSEDSTVAFDTPHAPTLSETIDRSLFMTFENRSNEHLFIGSLLATTTTTTTAAQDASSAMEDVIYLGGVPVDRRVHAPQVPVREARDVALTNLTDCTINLVHDILLGAIHIKNLRRCTLVVPPVSGSILLHDCEDCTIIGACHQSRMHTSKNLTIYLHVTSEPIIEDCIHMRFAPYPYVDILPEEQLARLFQVAQLDPAKNFYDQVKDFNWLKQQQSPNWRLLAPEEIQPGVAESVLAKNSSF
ncbi:hypothetical protein BGZ70_010083 [Mortierella alpina]|uniref:C-CAP/cofactor C-like domain-containing protein n=1 Tax=Mortierella alpina TaxID=64518 RepID=A0A9P6LZS6_MORAP|nr:hypothetical protein BGZ70_010083 [Mortierella alpina]